MVGCGRHATTSLYPALRPAGLELVATCARTLSRAQETARAFGALRAHYNVADLLAPGDLDAVLLCLPVGEYAGIASAVLAAGLPVFCEKPGAASSAELSALADQSARLGVPVMVGYMKRFARAYRVATDYATSSTFGRTTSVHVKFVIGPGYGSLPAYVVDNTVHALDLLRLFGGEVADLQARVLTLDDNRHAVSALVQFESGAVGTAQLATTASFFQENELVEVIGEQHSLTVTNVDTVVCRRRDGAVEMDRPTYTVPLPAKMTGTVMGFVPELEHFRAVVTDGIPCASDATSALRTLELTDRLLTACRQ
jgi:predicted dehydrogenase